MHTRSEQINTARSFWLGRVVGYLASATFASLFYLAWIFCEQLWLSRDASVFLGLSGLIVFLFIGGFALVFLPLMIPWIAAVIAFPRAKLSGNVYFTVAGAILVFVTGCLVTSLMPKPLFIEDQTFYEAVLIAVKREGVCFALAGCIFGASYWFLCERHVGATRSRESRNNQ
jgi:hypothetical protein